MIKKILIISGISVALLGGVLSLTDKTKQILGISSKGIVFNETTGDFDFADTNNNGNDSNTVLYIKGDNDHTATAFHDYSANAHAITANADVKHVGTFRLASTSSIYFDGTGDGLTMADHNDFDITGNFTLEAWTYYNDRPDVNGEVYRILARGDVVANNGDWAWGIGSAAGWPDGVGFRHNFAIKTGGSINEYTSPVMTEYDAPVNTWNHWALVRNGADILYFLNGVLQETEATATESMSGTTSIYVGARLVTAALDEEFKGLMDEVRFSNVARYTANFTPVRNHGGYSFKTTDAGGTTLIVPYQIER